MNKFFEFNWWYKSYLLVFICVLVSFFAAARVEAKSLTIEIDVPKLDVDPYHRPYVAVWVETAERNPVQTIDVWYEQDDWLKDLRQWWRKLGRSQKDQLDGISSATKKPGMYRLTWDGKGQDGKLIADGEYILHLEASREEGGRSYMRQKFQWGEDGVFNLDAKPELGPVVIKVTSK